VASTLESAAELIVGTLLPLAGALEAADEDVVSFVRRLGWELPSVPPGIRDLQTPSAALVEHLGELRLARLGVEEGTASDDDVTRALALVAADLIVLPSARCRPVCGRSCHRPTWTQPGSPTTSCRGCST